MKKITSIKIDKLFGTFNYEINFEKNDGFTILTAPNGFGKSTILKIIRAAAAGNFCYFAGLVFDRIEMNFKGTLADEWKPRFGPGSEPLPEEEAVKPKETKLVIEKSRREIPEEDSSVAKSREMDEDAEPPYICMYSVDDVVETFTDEDIQRAVNEVVNTIPTLEPMFQYVNSNGECRLWRDKSDGEVFDLSEVFRRYSGMFRKMFPWIYPIVRKLNFSVNYISTNRLYNEDSERSLTGMSPRFRGRPVDAPQDIKQNTHLLKIFSISSDMRSASNRCMREQLQIARNQESDFVVRVVDSLNKKDRPSVDEIRKRISNKITAIRRLEGGCNEFGITSGSKMNKVLETNDDSALIVFEMYLDDVKNKLTVFTPLVKKLKIFSDALRDLLDLKTVKIDLSSWDNVLEVRSSTSNAVIPLDMLSSGEQHLIVLLGRLLFSVDDPDTLVMMDEPEISFHPRWQEDFSEILFRIQNELREGRSGRRQFIIATHSPAFIGDHWDKTVELAKMLKETDGNH